MPKFYGTAMPRQISPSAPDSLTLSRCSLGANALFWLLISQSDDQGRQHGDPVRVRGKCFPLRTDVTVDHVEAWLDELVRAHLVLRYEAAGEQVVQVRSWHEHQSGQRWVYPSRWPAPEGWTDLPLKQPKGSVVRSGSGTVPESRRSDAGATPGSVVGVGVGSVVGGANGAIPEEKWTPELEKDLRGFAKSTDVALAKHAQSRLKKHGVDWENEP